MRFVNHILPLENDTITIPMDQPCPCNVGLVEISLSNCNEKGVMSNAIDISCEQIDSTVDNPTRILRRLALNRCVPNEYYQTWVARHIQMEKIDSSDKFLTLKIRRTKTGEALKFQKYNDTNVHITLAFSEATDSQMWTTYI